MRLTVKGITTLLTAFVAFAVTLLLTGCESNRTINGKQVPCVGLNSAKDTANYAYEYSTANILSAFVFSETIIVPYVVIMDSFSCPIPKTASKP